MDCQHLNKDYLEQYTDLILSGGIKSGKFLRMQLEILKEHRSNPEIKVDMAEADKRIRFIEQNCKHSISPFAGKPFLLELWQKAFIEACYGFYMMSEGKWVRLHTHALLEVARKCGKSSIAAAMVNAEFFCGNMGTHIFCTSNDYEQAGLVFEEVNNMREESSILEKVTRKTIKGIFFGNRKQKKTKGKFTKQNKAEIKKMSSKGTGGKEGRNIDFAIIDESHEMKDDSLVKPIEQSASTKDEYLILEITTEGFTEDGHLDKELKYRKQILKGEIEGIRKLSFLYEQDNEEEIWTDESSWIKSNPNLGVSKKVQYLRDTLQVAQTDAEARAFTLAKDFNLKQSTAISWLKVGEAVNTETFDLEEFRNAFYVGGYDFAETTDLCSFTMLFLKDDKIYTNQMYWITNDKLNKKADENSGAKYSDWVRDGYIVAVADSQISTDIVAEYEYKLFQEYGIKPFKGGYDNRFAKGFINRHKEIFGGDILENVPQDAKCLSNSMRAVGNEFRKKNIIYNNNPVSLWCFKNTGVKLDSIGRAMPCKMETERRIDGSASLLDAYHILSIYKTEFKNINK